MANNKYRLWLERFGLEYLRRLAEQNLSEEEIALRSGLELPTFRLWKRKYPDFAEALNLGREESDFGVIHALYKKATGHNVSLKKTYKLKRVEYDPDTGKKLREFEELATGVDETYVPADLSAEKFWLKNRQPNRWSEGEKTAENEEREEGGVVVIPQADKLDAKPEDSE